MKVVNRMGGLVSKTDVIALLMGEYETAKMCARKAFQRADTEPAADKRRGYTILACKFDRRAAYLEKLIGMVEVMPTIGLEVVGYGKHCRNTGRTA